MKRLLNLNIVWDLNYIDNLRNDLNSVKELNKKELKKVREPVNDIEWWWSKINWEGISRAKREDKRPDQGQQKMFSKNQRLYNETKALYQS